MLSQHLDCSSNVHSHTNMRAATAVELSCGGGGGAFIQMLCHLFVLCEAIWQLIVRFWNICFPFARNIRCTYVLLFDCARGGGGGSISFFCFASSSRSWSSPISVDNAKISMRCVDKQKKREEKRVCTCPKKFPHKLCTPQNRSGLISKCVFIIYVNNDIIERAVRCFLFYSILLYFIFYLFICRNLFFFGA